MNVCETCLNNIFNDILRYGSPQMESMRLCSYCVGKVKSLQEFALRCSNADGSLALNQNVNFDVQKLIEFCRQQFRFSENENRARRKPRNRRRPINTNRDLCRLRRLFETTNNRTKIIGRRTAVRSSPHRKRRQKRELSETKKPKFPRGFPKRPKKIDEKEVSKIIAKSCTNLKETAADLSVVTKQSGKLKQIATESKALESYNVTKQNSNIAAGNNINKTDNTMNCLERNVGVTFKEPKRFASNCIIASKERKAMKEFETKSKGFAIKIARLEKLMALIKNKKKNNLGKVIKDLDSQLRTLIDQRKKRTK